MARDWVIERTIEGTDEWKVMFGPAGMMECLRAFPDWLRWTTAYVVEKGPVQALYRIRKKSTGEVIPGEAIQ